MHADGQASKPKVITCSSLCWIYTKQNPNPGMPSERPLSGEKSPPWNFPLGSGVWLSGCDFEVERMLSEFCMGPFLISKFCTEHYARVVDQTLVPSSYMSPPPFACSFDRLPPKLIGGKRQEVPCPPGLIVCGAPGIVGSVNGHVSSEGREQQTSLFFSLILDSWILKEKKKISPAFMTACS